MGFLKHSVSFWSAAALSASSLFSLASADNSTVFANTTLYNTLCENLYNFTGNLEAVTKVTFVNYVPYNASNDVPGFCNATGYINGYTGFQIVLPANASQYAGTFTSQGCGGSCGTYRMLKSKRCVLIGLI